MTTESNIPPNRRRRWFRFSLRTGLILVTVLCGWLAMEMPRIRRRDHAVDGVRELRGEVFFAHQFPRAKAPYMNPGQNWATKPLDFGCKLVGLAPDAYSRMVVTVNFDNTPDMHTYRASNVTNEALKLLRSTPYVRELLLSNNRSITDEGLEFVSHLKKLRVLTLRNTNVTGAGLRNISAHNGLVGISLTDTPLTDEGLTHLKELENLEWLHLSDTSLRTTVL